MEEFNDDLQLWKAVAEKRDGNAFAQLYHHHEQAAYNLAFYITHNQADAEEALQEALVRAWNCADGFRGEGSVRGWLLRIVARESLRKIQERRKAATVKEGFAMTDSGSASTESEAERGELIDALRKQLELLPQVDRELLAFHFGGGLSQDEIGSALQYSQQTVSLRIQKAISHLRAKLTHAGLASAVLLLETERLQEAFHGGYSIPQNLAGKMLGHVTAATKTGVRHSGRTGSASKMSVNSFIAIAALSAAVATGFYYFSGKSDPVAKAPRVEAQRPESGAAGGYILTLQEGQPVLGLTTYVGARDAAVYFNEPAHQSTPTLYVWQGWLSLIGFAVFANEGGPLPDKTEIIEAKLSILELDDTSTEQLGLYRVLSPWKVDDVSWEFAASKVKWKTPGGDCEEKAAAFSQSQGKKKAWCEFDVTESLSKAQKEGKNYGWLLSACVNGIRKSWAGGWMQFVPSHFPDDPLLRPKLTLKVRYPKLPNDHR